MELEIRQRRCQKGTTEKPPSPKPVEKLNEIPAKEFVLRNSILTDLLEIPHFRSIYNICLALFVLVWIHTTILYCIDPGKLKKNISILTWTSRKFHIVAFVWIAMNVSIVFMLYPTFRFWATTRSGIKTIVQKYYDLSFCTLFIVYQLGLLVFPAKVIVTYNLPPLSLGIVVIEQLRLIMKVHAFVRESAPRALRYKPHILDGDKEDSKPCPEVGKLIYFLFAPTLVYRDNYPRTPFIRWSYVARNFLEGTACVLAAYIPIFHSVIVIYEKNVTEPITLVNIIENLTTSLFISVLMMFLMFYSFFHCWLNAFSEMLQFGDRMFYGDWWNFTSFAKFYRSWSMVVHDWLHTYIYRDMYTVLNRSRIGATISVFILSAMVHDYMIALAFRFICPLLFILSVTFAVAVKFITRGLTSNIWSVIFWISLLPASQFIAIFYIVEWHARTKCPGTLDQWLDYLLPRSFTCNIMNLSSS